MGWFQRLLGREAVEEVVEAEEAPQEEISPWELLLANKDSIARELRNVLTKDAQERGFARAVVTPPTENHDIITFYINYFRRGEEKPAGYVSINIKDPLPITKSRVGVTVDYGIFAHGVWSSTRADTHPALEAVLTKTQKKVAISPDPKKGIIMAITLFFEQKNVAKALTRVLTPFDQR